MRRTKADAEQTRKLIIDTALERFAARGFDSCSLAEIATSAGLTRGAIYWHFKNKSELLEAIVDDFSAPLIATENAMLSENETDPLGKLRDLLILILRSVAIDQSFRQIFTLCQRMRTLGFNQDDNLIESQYLRELTVQRRERRVQVLRNAVAKGQLPAGTDCQAATQFLLASVEGLAFAWLADPASFPLETLAESFIDTVLAGIKHSEPLHKIPV